MKRLNILSFVVIGCLFFFGQNVQAGTAGYGDPANLNRNPSSNSSSNSNSNFNPNSIPYGNSMPAYGSSMPSSAGGYNMYQNGGLFGGGNFYIYPAPSIQPGAQSTNQPNTQLTSQPEQLIANRDGSCCIYPAGYNPSSNNGTTAISNQPQWVIPNGDGTLNIYPPGYNPYSNNGTNDVSNQPEKVVPDGNGGYYIYPPPFTGLPPQRIIPNGDGTYNIYPAGGGAPERVVPMNAGQSSPQMQSSAPMPMPATMP